MLLSRSRIRWVSTAGLWIAAALVSVGVYRAYTHAGKDFSVFYGAWRLILEGHGSEIYHVSIDRFLYAPGFAFLLSPLGLLSRNSALIVWCLLKAFVVGSLIRMLSPEALTEPGAGAGAGAGTKAEARAGARSRLIALGLTAWGVVLLARPLLIDFEYGQVNLFIVGACVWGLLGHFKKEASPFWDGLRWCLLAFAALAKLFPIPLLVVPWVVTLGISNRKLNYERWGVAIGVLLTLLIPIFILGWDGNLNLLHEWRDALFARGLPLESHNQSFTALLHHYLSGSPTPIHSEGGGPLIFGHRVLSLVQIELLSLAWTCITMGVTLGWIVSGSNHPPMKWIAIAVGLLIVPSHLIWKPYFVMSIPLAVLVLRQRGGIVHSLLILALFVGINLTGFDFIGHHWAAHFEAASILLVMHLVLLGMAFSNHPQLCEERD